MGGRARRRPARRHPSSGMWRTRHSVVGVAHGHGLQRDPTCAPRPPFSHAFSLPPSLTPPPPRTRTCVVILSLRATSSTAPAPSGPSGASCPGTTRFTRPCPQGRATSGRGRHPKRLVARPRWIGGACCRPKPRPRPARPHLHPPRARTCTPKRRSWWRMRAARMRTAWSPWRQTSCE